MSQKAAAIDIITETFTNATNIATAIVCGSV